MWFPALLLWITGVLLFIITMLLVLDTRSEEDLTYGRIIAVATLFSLGIAVTVAAVAIIVIALI